MTSVRLEPAAPRSRVKHSTTEPVRSMARVRGLLVWKEAMEEKGLSVNAGKTKAMICGKGLDLLLRRYSKTCLKLKKTKKWLSKPIIA